MKNKFGRFMLGILLSIMLLFSASTFADVGNFESYDSDWDSDSSWSSDSSSSRNSGSSWGSGSRYDSSSSTSSKGGYHSSYSGNVSSISGVVLEIVNIIAWIIMILGVLCIVLVEGRNTLLERKRRAKISSVSRTAKPIISGNIAQEIQKVDPYFNEEKFLAWTKNLFVKLQMAWTERDWEVIRPFETEELFEQHSMQIKQYIDNKQINVMDRITVNYAKLYDFKQDNDKDTLKIVLNSSMLDYIIDADAKILLKGDRDRRRNNTYVMTFIRKKGIQTSQSTDGLKTTNCPNCGAPTKITSSGKCTYCGSVITTSDHDWVLSNLEPFRG